MGRQWWRNPLPDIWFLVNDILDKIQKKLGRDCQSELTGLAQEISISNLLLKKAARQLWLTSVGWYCNHCGDAI